MTAGRVGTTAVMTVSILCPTCRLLPFAASMPIVNPLAVLVFHFPFVVVIARIAAALSNAEAPEIMIADTIPIAIRTDFTILLLPIEAER